MKRSLLFKLILCYIICISVIFFIINTLGSFLCKRVLASQITSNLQEICSEVTQNYLSPLVAGDISPLEFRKNIYNVASELSATVWYVSSKGRVSIDTSESITSEKKYITDADPDFLESESGSSYTLDKFIAEPSFYAISSYDKDDATHYIVIFITEDYYDSLHSDIMLTINILGILSSLAIALLYIIIYFLTIHPVHKITKAAMEYSKGHFNYPLEIRANDEYHELGLSIKYMAGEMYNLDDYQRKFIGNISHDFRSPLTSIKGYIQAMIDGTIPPENREKYLNIVLYETERLSGLMTKLLTLNSFDHNKKALDRANFDINDIILKTAQTYEGTCEKKKIEFQFNFEREKQIVWAEQPLIQQVLNNLIDNALKFSPSYSSVEISTSEHNDKVFISIKDHGIGISSNSINRIWERFYKSDTSRGKDKKGTGLGLAITKEIITSHGEHIDVISTEGVGTEFIFTLPPRHMTKVK